MNPEFQKALVQFLERYQKVSIPDLGGFYMVRNNPVVLTDSKIASAEYNIEFKKNGQDNLAKFENFLMNMFHFGKTKAQQFIKQSVSQIHDLLNNESKLVCKDLGEFVKEGDQIKFTAYNNYINDQNYGLPIIKLIPIERTLEEKRALLEKSNTKMIAKDQKPDRTKFWELLIITILIALCIGALWLLYNAFNKEKIVDTAKNDKVDIQIEEPSGHQNKNINSIILDSSNFNSQYDAVHSSQLDTYDHEIIIPFNDPSSVITKGLGKECVVIVGSFKRNANKKAMILKLENMGYDVHTESFGDFNRVGVRFDCLTNDLYNMLSVLRGEIDKKAWILKY